MKQESEVAQREEQKTAKVKLDAEEKQASATEDLKKAQPLKEQALEAIACIDKKQMTELASFAQPPGQVDPVMQAVCLILSEPGRPAKDLSWKAAKKHLSNVTGFISRLQTFHQNWDNDIMNMTKQRVAKWTFKGTDVKKASEAAFNIYTWLINICTYHTVVQNIAVIESHNTGGDSRRRDCSWCRRSRRSFAGRGLRRGDR